MRNELRLEVLRGPGDIAAIEKRWQELANSLPSATLSQLPDFYLAFTDAFRPEPDELMIAAIQDSNGRIIAIFPLCIRDRDAYGAKIRALKFPEVPMPVREVLIERSHSPGAIIEFLLDNIGQALGCRWDYLQFRTVLGTSGLLDRAAGEMKYTRVVQHVGFSHLLDVSRPGYVERVLNSKARNNIRRNQKKLAQLGNFEFQTCSQFPELEDAYDVFLATEAAGWKSVRGGKRAVKLHPRHTRFYYELMKRCVPKDGCDIHLLYLDGEAIAADYCINVAGKCYSIKHGYDERFSAIAPGNLLRAYAVEYYGELKNIEFVDLISGMEWHLAWKPERRRVFDIKFFNQSLRGGFLKYLAKSKRSQIANDS